ncbi:MAG: alpha/beta hydrolase [Hyphomicrobiales bacterium]|nr:alpha/beta hydrolase [Hyphomicrobiales bacterium]
MPDTDTTILIGHRGQAIAASIRGDNAGLPVILAHGGGQTRRAWRNTADRLAKCGFCAVAIDMRGHGESAWAEDGAYDIRDFASDLVALAQACRQRPALIGASLGGLAGIIAEGNIRPQTFSSLTLVDVTPQMDPKGIARVVGFMAAHARNGFASPEEAAHIIAEYMPHRRKQSGSTGLHHYLRFRSDGRYYWHWDPAFIEGIVSIKETHPESNSLRRSIFDSAASSLKLPVHLIRGDASDLVSPSAVSLFKALVPHAEISDIAGATHMVVGDKNDIFTDAILEFLIRTYHDASP